MMILVVGGSGSGKSAYAEEMTDLFCKEMPENAEKYYLATMQVFDEEGRRKVERHRKLRAGKGFLTVEQPVDIHGALDRMGSGGGQGGRVVLLECLSNLVANEMFPAAGVIPETEGTSGMEMTQEMAVTPMSETAVAEKIIRGIVRLKEGTTHLVIVGNNVSEDGISYDASTMAYLRAMGCVNRELAAMADRVVEVVAGIPVMVKGATCIS